MPVSDHRVEPEPNCVDQILATHCTYGTSAFERETGERGRRVLGYSVRASSILDSRRLRATYRSIEPYLSYELPPDAPAGLKLQLTPEAGPRDLMYTTLPGGRKVVAHVCHRQWDAVRQRPGAFFAHVLCWEDVGVQDTFSALQALQLWRAGGWELAENAETPHDIPPYQRAMDVLQNAPPIIDDGELKRFLWEEGAFTPTGFLPARWLQMPAETRRKWFRLAFEGYLQVLDRANESVVLVTEPDAAVYLFYGIARLAGPVFGQDLSFSTYGVSAQRVATKLKAINFWKSAQIPVEELRRSARGVLVNTFGAAPLAMLPGSPSPPAGSAYLNILLGKLQHGWHAVDHVQQLAVSLLPRAPTTHQPTLKTIALHLDKIACGEQTVVAIFSANHVPPPARWADDDVQCKFVDAEATRHLAEQGEAAAQTVSAEFLLTALQWATRRDAREAERVVFTLFDRLPPGEREAFLKLPNISRRWKLRALWWCVQRERCWPEGCVSLAKEDPYLLGDFLQQLCQQKPEFVDILWQGLDREKQIGLLAKLSREHRYEPVIRDLVPRLPEEDLQGFLQNPDVVPDWKLHALRGFVDLHRRLPRPRDFLLASPPQYTFSPGVSLTLLGRLLKDLERSDPQLIESLWRELGRGERVPFLARLSDLDFATVPPCAATDLMVAAISDDSDEGLTEDNVQVFLDLVPTVWPYFPLRVKEALQSRLDPLVQAAFDDPDSFERRLPVLQRFCSLLGQEQQVQCRGLIQFAEKLNACRTDGVSGKDLVSRLAQPLRDSHNVYITDHEGMCLAKFVHAVVKRAGLEESLPASPVQTIKAFLEWKKEDPPKYQAEAMTRVEGLSITESTRNRRKSRKRLSAEQREWLLLSAVCIVLLMIVALCAIGLLYSVKNRRVERPGYGHERSVVAPITSPLRFDFRIMPHPYPRRVGLWPALRVPKW